MGMDRFLTAEEAAKLTKGVEAQVYKLCQRIKIEAKKGNTSVEVYDLDNVEKRKLRELGYKVEVVSTGGTAVLFSVSWGRN